MNYKALDILAKTIYGEARGEGGEGQYAVACVVLNRVAFKRANGKAFWWGASIETVCLKPWQFSCWNNGDKNRGKLLNLKIEELISSGCLESAVKALAQHGFYDPTEGSTHYHVSWLSKPISWGMKIKPTVVINNHLFYIREL